MKRLMNSPEGVLDEALQGFASANSDLVRFDPVHHTMFRREGKLDRKATPPMELYTFCHLARKRLESLGHRVERRLVGTFRTTLDMAGASLTVTKFDEKMPSLWDAPAETPTLRCR
jgi:dihydroxyacetone kinase